MTIERFDAADCAEDVVESIDAHTIGFRSLESLKQSPHSGNFAKLFKITISIEEIDDER